MDITIARTDAPTSDFFMGSNVDRADRADFRSRVLSSAGWSLFLSVLLTEQEGCPREGTATDRKSGNGGEKSASMENLFCSLDVFVGL